MAKLTPAQERENARIGYQVATSLIAYEGSLIWSKYNAMLVANSIVLGIIGICFVSETAPKLVPAAMAICGLISCLAWCLLMSRGWEYYKYWILSAREIEEQHLGPIQTLSRGGEIADGGTGQLTISGEVVFVSFGRATITARAASYWVIYAFVALYVATLLLSLFRALCPTAS